MLMTKAPIQEFITRSLGAYLVALLFNAIAAGMVIVSWGFDLGSRGSVSDVVAQFLTGLSVALWVVFLVMDLRRVGCDCVEARRGQSGYVVVAALLALCAVAIAYREVFRIPFH
ncbi:MAG: hypothetical protein FKY71_17670 [Spiribacter salinus]|uniref:Uncharacterized protein n=1 Tax=Spiribacter salinus TaxID=1335746 RepID=A0A540VC67_9GAMM|nr:MAG: hypothetical protein FKY71_17670 [Spiribacter salinus]